METCPLAGFHICVLQSTCRVEGLELGSWWTISFIWSNHNRVGLPKQARRSTNVLKTIFVTLHLGIQLLPFPNIPENPGPKKQGQPETSGTGGCWRHRDWRATYTTHLLQRLQCWTGYEAVNIMLFKCTIKDSKTRRVCWLNVFCSFVSLFSCAMWLTAQSWVCQRTKLVPNVFSGGSGRDQAQSFGGSRVTFLGCMWLPVAHPGCVGTRKQYSRQYSTNNCLASPGHPPPANCEDPEWFSAICASWINYWNVTQFQKANFKKSTPLNAFGFGTVCWEHAATDTPWAAPVGMYYIRILYSVTQCLHENMPCTAGWVFTVSPDALYSWTRKHCYKS